MIQLVGYRAANYRTPMRDAASSQPGRFHDQASPPTQYLCLHPLGPCAEIIRHARLEFPQQLSHLAVRIWEVRLELPDDSPVIDFAAAGDAGLSAEDLVSDDYRATQALGDRLRSAGTVGFITQSAALPGTENVVLLGERVAISHNDDPVEQWEIPTSMTSSTGTPPESLFPLVRRFGHPHAAQEAWRRGDEYRFSEPDWRLPPPATG